MSNVKGEMKGFLDVKRFYMEGVIIEHKCEKCGNLIEKDLGHDYFSEPKINEIFEDYLFCSNCNHENKIKFKINLSLDTID